MFIKISVKIEKSFYFINYYNKSKDHDDSNNLGGDYMIPVCQDEISTRPAGAYFTLRLHVEIKFHHGKAGQFSTCYLFRFAGTFFEFFFCKHVSLRIENP